MQLRSFAIVLAAAAGIAGSAGAQGTGTTTSSSCPAGSDALTRERVTQDACQKAVDLFQFMAPQLGTAIAGGNATLGQGGTLGGIGKFSVGLRVNIVGGSMPQVGDVSPAVTGAEQTEYETKRQVLPMPAADVAIGIFKGLPLGLTNVGGIDALVNASYLPEYDGDELQVRVPDGSLKLGYGARLGVVQESFVVPGVSFTYMKRDLPRVSLTANTADGSITVDDLDLETTALRLTASKKFLVFGAAIGVGQDRYKSSARAQGQVAGQQSDVIALEQTLKRTNYFADLSLNLPIFKLIGEIGQVSGGDIQTYNTFKDRNADDSLLYGSLGFRLSF